jgi:hypothetical protein
VTRSALARDLARLHTGAPGGWHGFSAAPAWLAGRGGRRAAGACATSWTRSATSPTTGRCGGHCPPTSRPRAPSTGGWIDGRPTAPPSGCTMTCATVSAWPLGARRSPPPRSRIPSRLKGSEMIGRGHRGYDAGKKTSDAEDVSSGQGGTGLPCRGEGCVLIEACALGQAVMKAADHAFEEVALGGCVRVSGFAARSHGACCCSRKPHPGIWSSSTVGSASASMNMTCDGPTSAAPAPCTPNPHLHDERGHS